eukprot:3136812-Amphidinium_carterae.1
MVCISTSKLYRAERRLTQCRRLPLLQDHHLDNYLNKSNCTEDGKQDIYDHRNSATARTATVTTTAHYGCHHEHP